MNLKGFDQLRQHIPDLNTPRGLLRMFSLPVLLYLMITVVFAAANLASPLWLLGSIAVLGSAAFSLMFLFFHVKANFKVKYGSLAYSRAVSRFGYPASAIIVAILVRIGSIPGPPFPQFWWYPLLRVVGWSLIVTAAVLFLRALQTFGVDNLTMLYVYYPEESRLVDHKIYEVLRHPAYGAAQRLVLGLAVLNGNIFALICAAGFTLGMWVWVHFVEEKELLERFGSAYAEYRRRVPAFWPHPRDLGRYFKFLIAGS